MQLGRTFGDGSSGDTHTFLDRMRVRTFLPGTFVKTAEFAVGDADIRVVEMPIDVVIGRQSVLLASNKIGQFTDRVEVIRRVKRKPIVKRQTLAVLDFVGDVAKLGVK